MRGLTAGLAMMAAQGAFSGASWPTSEERLRAPTRQEVQAAGNASDPYRGIASKGRAGSWRRALAMARPDFKRAASPVFLTPGKTKSVPRGDRRGKRNAAWLAEVAAVRAVKKEARS